MIGRLGRAGRATRARATGERGSTLTELLVTMTILGIVIAATAALTIGFQRTNAQNISRQDQIDTARTAVESMSKTLRTAVKPVQVNATCSGCTQDALVAGSDFAVTFYGDLNNQANKVVGPSVIAYAVSTAGTTKGQLIETIQIPDSLDATGVTGYAYCDATAAGATALCKARLTTRPVGFGILTPAGAPIFTYYDKTGAQLTPVSGGGLAATDLKAVFAIEIVVQAQTGNASKVPPTTYIQRVMLPNAQAAITHGLVTP